MKKRKLWKVALTLVLASGCSSGGGSGGGSGGKKNENSNQEKKTPTLKQAEVKESIRIGSDLALTADEKIQITLQKEVQSPTNTAAFTCEYSKFQDYTYYSGKKGLDEPIESKCKNGYTKATNQQQVVTNYKTPTAIASETPKFPTFLEFHPLFQVNSQNTTGINTTLPVLDKIDTKSCHTAEVRFPIDGGWQNYRLKRNLGDSFDLQSTDQEPVFSEYARIALVADMKSYTKRYPVEVVYLCDWKTSRTVDNGEFSTIDSRVKKQVGSKPLWNAVLRGKVNDELVELARLENVTAKKLYEVLSKASLGRYGEYKLDVSIRDENGKLIATNTKATAEKAGENAKNAWASQCENINNNLQLDYYIGKQFQLCDLSNGFYDPGVKTPVHEARPEMIPYVAPIRCSLDHLQRYLGLAPSGHTRQVCSFAAPSMTDLDVTLQGPFAHPSNWQLPESVLELHRDKTKIDRALESGKIEMEFRSVKRVHDLSLADCRHAGIQFKSRSGESHFVALDKFGISSIDTMNYSRSSQAGIDREESAAAALAEISDHLEDHPDYDAKVDIFFFCDYWANPGEDLSQL